MKAFDWFTPYHLICWENHKKHIRDECKRRCGRLTIQAFQEAEQQIEKEQAEWFPAPAPSVRKSFLKRFMRR